MKEWMLTREERDKATADLSPNATFGEEREAELKAQVRKVVKWLFTLCIDQSHYTKYQCNPVLRIYCERCREQLRKEVEEG